jgi:hypothetical protein
MNGTVKIGAFTVSRNGKETRITGPRRLPRTEFGRLREKADAMLVVRERERAERELDEIRLRARSYEKVEVPQEPRQEEPAPAFVYARVGPFGTISYGPGWNSSAGNYSLRPRDYTPPKGA